MKYDNQFIREINMNKRKRKLKYEQMKKEHCMKCYLTNDYFDCLKCKVFLHQKIIKELDAFMNNKSLF